MFVALVFVALYLITGSPAAALFLMLILTPELILLWVAVELLKRIFSK